MSYTSDGPSNGLDGSGGLGLTVHRHGYHRAGSQDYTNVGSIDQENDSIELENQSSSGSFQQHPNTYRVSRKPVAGSARSGFTPLIHHDFEEDGQDAPANTTKGFFSLQSWPTLAKNSQRFDIWQRTNRYAGWRLGVLTGCILSTVVLFINVILFVVGATTNGGYVDGFATLHKGPAGRIGNLSTMYHVLINILSTSLLSASNYTMQVLCSPTRNEVDKAHAKGQYLNIGILSTRNIWSISKRRLALWWILALSSVPLHLFYNAAVFKVTSGNQYMAQFVNLADPEVYDSLIQMTKNKKRNETLQLMNNTEWRRSYSSQYVSETGDIYLIVDQLAFQYDYFTSPNHNFSDFDLSQPMSLSVDPINDSPLTDTMLWQEGYWYIPDNIVYLNKTLNSSGNYAWYPEEAQWTINPNNTFHISHSFVKPAIDPNTSKVQIGLIFMAIVIGCNFVKALIMLITFLDHRSSYLVTTGDALASFLSRPDPTTVGCCVSSYDNISQRINKLKEVGGVGAGAMQDSSTEGEFWVKRWRLVDNAISSFRGKAGYFLCSITVIGGIALPVTLGLREKAWGPASPLTFSLGTHNTFNTQDLLLNASLANLPQIYLSIYYITFNGLYTCVAMAYEWNALGIKRRGLRVTKAEGEQRSTHFLQLPYRWALPIAGTSGVLHWLMSETLFLVRADVRNRNGELLDVESFSACGYSLSSLLTLVLVSFLPIIVTGWVVSRPLKQRVPFAAGNSLVVSAACHAPADDIDVHLKKVIWGEVGSFQGVGHCSLTSGEMKEPAPGTRYA